jgi:hypothetical protein
MPKIRIVVSHCIGAGVDVKEGDVLEVTVSEARRKIQMGFAVAVSELPPEEGMVQFAGSPSITEADPKVRGRK